MQDIFIFSPALIVFLHVLSAVVWVGGMIALRFVFHSNLQLLDTPKERLKLALFTIKRFFNIVIFFIVILVATAVVLAIGMGFKGTPLYMVVHIKEAIWAIMTVNFVYMYFVRNKAEKVFYENDLALTAEKLSIIVQKLIPINIILGVVAIMFGVILRGF